MGNTMDINEGAKLYKETAGAVLLDVRKPDEYSEGHIPGSINIPVQEIEKAKEAVTDLNTPVFVYCLSGVRGRKAAAALIEMGYTNVTCIGGMKAYTGEVEK